MATEAESIAAARANLFAALANATARLAELDTVPVDQRARMTYTDGQQTYDWNGFRAALMAQLQGLEERITGLSKIAGPFTISQVVR